MNIIISGGLGYVGGRLSKYLAENGHTVTALSRQANSLPDLVLPTGMTVAHPDVFAQHPDRLNVFDVFIHLAALNENDCVTFPEKAIEVNITHTWQWLDRAYKAGIKQFIYFSTAHVYGKPLQGYYDEESPTHPVHPYAITHKCAEDYVLSYRHEKGMDNLVLRLTNAFGGPAFPTADRWTLLVNDLCRSAVATGTMTLQTDGLQVRDFVCLQDVCTAVNHLLGAPHAKTTNGIFNIGAGKSISVREMANHIKKVAEDYLNKPIIINLKKTEKKLFDEALFINIGRVSGQGFDLKNNIDEEIRSTLAHFFNFKLK